MNNELGEAVVKIIGDITPLKQAVKEAEVATNSLKNFKVDWGTGSGSLSEYSSYLEQATENYSNLANETISAEQALRNVGGTVYQASSSMQTLADGAKNVTNETSKLSNILSTVGNAIAHPIETAKGALANFGESFESTTKKISHSKREIAVWGSLIGATIGKAVSSFAEFDQNGARNLENLKSNFTRAFASIGALLQPVIQLVSTIVGKIADLVGWVGSLFGITTNYSKSLKQLEQEEKAHEEAVRKQSEAYEKYQGTLSDVNKQISDIRKQIDEATEDYKDNLKTILDTHEDTVERLTQQIKDANADYQRAVDERTASFKVSQLKEEEEHQNKVDELMTQIDFLQRYNNKYNQEKLSQLQFELAKENRQYQEQTKAREEELDVQLRTEREKNEARIAEYQSELNEELSLLNKHRDLLNSVRDRIVLDEVESLTKQYNKQVASYNDQIALAQESGRKAGEEYTKAYLEGATQLNIVERMKSKILNLNTNVEKLLTDVFAGGTGRGYADGGFTGQGGKNEVAGVVHKGEYVIPQEQVNQATGQPKGIGGVTVNISMNGAFATSATERRKFAEEIRNEFNKIDFARLGA